MSKYLWAARDENGGLWLYVKKPYRDLSTFFPQKLGTYNERLPDELFPELTWENSPKRVKIELIDK
jgi:hypothetical protein